MCTDEYARRVCDLVTQHAVRIIPRIARRSRHVVGSEVLPRVVIDDIFFCGKRG
jgi:hypothetical protein